MNEKNLSLQEILASPHPDMIDIRAWIQNNIESENTLFEVLWAVGDNPEYFHILLEYAETSIRKWNFVHPKVSESLLNFFKNFDKFASQNSYAADFINNSLRWNILLRNNSILSSITHLDPETLDINLLVRLSDFFFHENKNPNVIEQKYFFRKILKTLAKKAPELAEREQIFNIENLVSGANFSLNEAYSLHFSVSEWSSFAWNYELSLLKRTGPKEIFDMMQKVDYNTFSHFVERFTQSGKNSIDFLAFENLRELEKEKRFYLSLATNSLIFEENEKQEFLDFILDKSLKDRGNVFRDNVFSDFGKILQFFSKIGISIFDSTATLADISTLIGKNESYAFQFEKYLDARENKKNFHNSARIKTALQTAKFALEHTEKKFQKFLILEILNFHSLKTLVEIEKNFALMTKHSSDYEIRQKILAVDVTALQREKYATIRWLFEMVANLKKNSEYDILDFFKRVVASSGGRAKYLVYYVAKKRRLPYGSYGWREVREKCFFGTLFVVRMWHWTKMKMEK